MQRMRISSALARIHRRNAGQERPSSLRAKRPSERIARIQCLALAKKLYPNHSVSLTSSSFMGGDIKAAARGLCLVGDCNMEDYHIFLLLHQMRYGRGMPHLFNSGLVRIDCDPPEIPAEGSGDELRKLIAAFADAFGAVLETAKLKKSDDDKLADLGAAGLAGREVGRR